MPKTVTCAMRRLFSPKAYESIEISVELCDEVGTEEDHIAAGARTIAQLRALMGSWCGRVAKEIQGDRDE